MTAHYDVAAIGNAIVDIICRCDDNLLDTIGIRKGQMRLIGSPDLIARVRGRCRVVTELAGGSAANTAVGLISLGGRAAFIGKVADDDFGRIFRHDINSIGVKFSTPPEIRANQETSHSLVLVTPDGQRTMLTFPGCSTEFHQSLIDPGIIEGARYVFLEGYLFDHPQAKTALFRATAIAKKAGRKVALALSDPSCVNNHRSEFFALIRSGVDLLIANEREIMALLGASRFEDTVSITARLVSTCALTRSEKGSIVVSKGEVTVVPAEAVKQLVDCTGAGDLYASGLIFGLARGLDLKAAGRLASFAAAEILSQMGARPQAHLEGLARMRGLLEPSDKIATMG